MEHLEGRQSILAALAARQRKFDLILIRHGAHLDKLRELIDLAERLKVPVRFVDRTELDAMAHGATHGGVIAICSPKPRLDAAGLLTLTGGLKEPPLLLLLEGIEDARNLGFTIRSAEAMGAHSVLVKKHLWDLDPTEIARPAAGAFERLPLAQIDSTEPLAALRKAGMQLVGCIAGARETIYDIDWTRASIVAIGGEKRGLSGAVRDICDAFVTIPTRVPGTSLSLSHAASVVLAEAMRQRINSGARRPLHPEPAEVFDVGDDLADQ